jgi:hypothetical protein
MKTLLLMIRHFLPYPRNIAAIFLLFCAMHAHAQTENLYSCISEDGEASIALCIEGIDIDVTNGKIHVYPKRNTNVGYVTSNFYPEIKGKISSIGNTTVSYVTSNFYPEIHGKVSAVGNTSVAYYTGNFYPEIKGKVKSIGNVSFEYYTGDFYPEIKGKVKAIGSQTITYYTGDFYPELKGKVKAISGS